MVEIHIHVHEDGASEERVAALEAQVMGNVEEIATVKANFAEFVEDINAKVTALETAVAENAGVTEAVADLKASVEVARTAFGDQDGDNNPPAPNPAPEGGALEGDGI